MDKKEKKEAVKKRMNKQIDEFIKRSKGLEVQEKKFRNKVMIDYNK